MFGWLAADPGTQLTAATRVERISLLEQIKGAICAAQAAETVSFAPVPGRRAAGGRGGTTARLGRGIAERIGLATKTSGPGTAPAASPWPAICGLELPATYDLLVRGRDL